MVYSSTPGSIGTEQQIAQPITGNLSERRKLKQAARLHVTEGVLLHHANVTAELPKVLAACVRGGVQNLIRVGYAVLRVIAFVTEGRKPGDRDET